VKAKGRKELMVVRPNDVYPQQKAFSSYIFLDCYFTMNSK